MIFAELCIFISFRRSICASPALQTSYIVSQMADILSSMKGDAEIRSPERKRPRGDGAFASSAASGGSLTSPEVTRILLQHDQELRQLHAALTLAMRLQKDAGLAQALLQAVRVWQQQHTKGKAHPFGSCGTATATVLLDLILTHVNNKPALQNEMAVPQIRTLLDQRQPHLIAPEVAHCSARVNAKETHVILEIRLTSSSTLQLFFSWMRLCLCDMGAELLGSKPVPNWARRVRAQQ